MVPRAGIEPARLAALVFETNASTNSAIWAASFRHDNALIGAVASAKVSDFSESHKLFAKKIIKTIRIRY